MCMGWNDDQNFYCGTHNSVPHLQEKSICKHSRSSHTVIPNTVCSDSNTRVTAWFADFPDQSVLQSVSSAVEQGGSLEGNEQ